MIKVCIADSFPVVIEGLQSNLQNNSNIEIIGTAKKFRISTHNSRQQTM